MPPISLTNSAGSASPQVSSSERRFPRKLRLARRCKRHSVPSNMVSHQLWPLCFLVSDDIVTELVQKEIKDCEANNKSWVIQGFPRTKVQALSLQKMGIIPDKFVCLKVKDSASLARIKNNLIGINQSLYGPELEDLATQCLQEYNLNMKGV